MKSDMGLIAFIKKYNPRKHTMLKMIEKFEHDFLSDDIFKFTGTGNIAAISQDGIRAMAKMIDVPFEKMLECFELVETPNGSYYRQRVK